MARHACAQAKQALAHSWQCGAACSPQAAAHASQTKAQSWQICRAKRLSLAIKVAASRQMAAQSRSSWMHSRIISRCASRKQEVAQWSQAEAHSLQALMQFAKGSVFMSPHRANAIPGG
jgi:hypothetical protein